MEKLFKNTKSTSNDEKAFFRIADSGAISDYAFTLRFGCTVNAQNEINRNGQNADIIIVTTTLVWYSSILKLSSTTT